MYKDIVINYGSEFENYTAAKLVENDFEAYRIVYRTPWDLTGCTVKAVCRRADGTIISGLGYTEGNSAMFVMDNNMYAVAGELNVRLTVYTAAEQIITVCDVTATAVEAFGDGIPGTNTKTILDQILVNISKLSTELEEHKAAEVIDHPDGSVIASKLAVDVKKYVHDNSLPEIFLACDTTQESLDKNILLYDDFGNAMEINAESFKKTSNSIYRIVFKGSDIEGKVHFHDKYGLLFQTKCISRISGINYCRVTQYLWLGDIEQYERGISYTEDNGEEDLYIGEWQRFEPENRYSRGKASGYAPLNKGALLDVKYIGEKAITGDKIADGTLSKAKLDSDLVSEIAVKADTSYVDSRADNLEAELDRHKSASELEHPDGSVTTEKIASGAVAVSKLSAEVQENIESREKSENKGVPDGYAPLDENGKIPDEYLYGSTVKEYGVRWKGTSSTDCERLGDAVGLVANAHLGVLSSVKNDFDNIYPWSEMRLCNLDAEGNILAYANEPTFKRDGTNGDVMVQIPKFYYKREKTAEGYEEWWICAVKLPGYELHPLFMDDGIEVSAVFHSAYNASEETLDNGTAVLRSISGVQPTVRESRSTFRTRARNKGTGWSIEDISCINALQMLYMVEYASTDSQAKLGKGASSLNYTSTHIAVEEGENTNDFVTATATANKYRVGDRIEIGTSQGINDKTPIPRTITAITARENDADISAITFNGDPVASIEVGNSIWNAAPLNGSCDELGDKSGYIGENGRGDSTYRGIEGFHGKLFRFIDGVNINDHIVYYANSTADYADDVYDGKYKAVGYTIGTANGYISEFGYDEKAPWVMFPTAVKGDSVTYVPDYYYQSTSRRLLAFGGYFNGSIGNGMFCFYCNFGCSHFHLNFGAHLIIKKP